MKIAFIHPDLGIGTNQLGLPDLLSMLVILQCSFNLHVKGGAERLVVDAAVGLQRLGHEVDMYTSHHDPSHCFAETRDGTLNVIVYGDWMPRTLFKRFHIVFATLRNIWLVSRLCLPKTEYDALFVDQISAGVPILKLAGYPVLFYCHFPDKLLSQRTSWIKSLYRLPIDIFEELTTDAIAVNSNFTRSVFHQEFPHISTNPEVVFPGIQTEAYDRELDGTDISVKTISSSRPTIVSINRFERKKNIKLAIKAFDEFLQCRKGIRPRLVIAGGYDSRVLENVEHHQELDQFAQDLGLSTWTWSKDVTKGVDADVVFIPSFSENQRTHLLATSVLLVYTPSNEHFGIVPTEAMYAGIPVVAVNSGGPLESVVDGTTGLLCPPEPKAFAKAFATIFDKTEEERREMGGQGRDRVKRLFSVEAMVGKIETILKAISKLKSGVSWIVYVFVAAIVYLFLRLVRNLLL